MKILDTFLQKIEPLFRKGGKLEKYYPLFEATDSFLFGASGTTDTAPHVRDAIDFKRIMVIVIIALIPCTFMAMWNTGYQTNLALQSLNITSPPGWRGEIMAVIGCSPESFIANFVHGALYFLPIYLVVVVVGSIWEGLFNLIRGHEISEAFLVTSLLFTLTLPPDPAADDSAMAGCGGYQLRCHLCQGGVWRCRLEFHEPRPRRPGLYLFRLPRPDVGE